MAVWNLLHQRNWDKKKKKSSLLVLEWIHSEILEEREEPNIHQRCG